MSTYWVVDDSGRILGPVSDSVIRDLVTRGRLQRLTKGSRDGKTWLPLAALPELSSLTGLQAPAPVAAGPFGGWTRGSDQKVRVELAVTAERAGIFTDVQAASLANGGFFLPCEKSLPIFEPVDVMLHFQTPTRDIAGAARIVCEVNLTNKRGVGVRFLSLSAEDKRFIEYFVRRTQPQR